MARQRKRAIATIAIWDLAWKAVAITVALRNGQKRWLVPLIAVSSGGVLPIVFLARFARKPGTGATPA